MKKCTDCRFCILIDYGYSNYTVEGTDADCLLHLNDRFPEDIFYGEDESLLFAENCGMFAEGDAVAIDVECELGNYREYSDDTGIQVLLDRFLKE